MSIQLGRWHFQSAPPAPRYLEKVQGALAGYGPDGTYSYSEIGVDILYAALHTTKESRREKQPQVTASGIVVTWDGRLDNGPATSDSDEAEPGSFLWTHKEFRIPPS